MEMLPVLRFNVGIHRGKIVSSWSCPQQHPGKSGMFWEFVNFPEVLPHFPCPFGRGEGEKRWKMEKP